jgi:hypothetical protein
MIDKRWRAHRAEKKGRYGIKETAPEAREREYLPDREERPSKPKTRKRGYKADPGKADLASPSHTAGITVVSG